MNLQQFLALVEQSPEDIDFDGVIRLIDSLYDFTPVSFQNGEQHNHAGENNGSCKVLAFAQRHGLDEQQTLACFGQYYQNDVRLNPAGNSHPNIRNFMEYGWAGVQFDAEALTPLEIAIL